MTQITDLMLKLNEIKFKSAEELKKYKAKHKMRDTTKVTIGGKETTAGEALGKKKKEPKADPKADTEPSTGIDPETGKPHKEFYKGYSGPNAEERYYKDHPDEKADQGEFDPEDGPVTTTDYLDDKSKARAGETPSIEQHVQDLNSITGDDSIEFDGYDANDRPIYISNDDPDTEYTVDQDGNIYKHDGFDLATGEDQKIGKTTPEKLDDPASPGDKEEFDDEEEFAKSIGMGSDKPLSKKEKSPYGAKQKGIGAGGENLTGPTDDANSISGDAKAEKKVLEKLKSIGPKDDVDLCSISVPGTNLFCANNKQIPRDEMPQLKSKPVEGGKADKLVKAGKLDADPETGEVNTEGLFKGMLEKEGVSMSEPTPRQVTELKATQNQLVGSKVNMFAKVLAGDQPFPDKDLPEKALKKWQDALREPIIVSNDGYILDGHHRWAALVQHDIANGGTGDVEMDVKEVDMGATALVDKTNKFTNDMGLAVKSGGKKEKKEGTIKLGNIIKEEIINVLKERYQGLQGVDDAVWNATNANIKRNEDSINEQRPMFQDTPNEFAYLDFKKWAYQNRGTIKKILLKALEDNRGDGTYLFLALRQVWLSWANKKAKQWSRIPNKGPDGKEFGRALAIMMKKDNLIIKKSGNKLTTVEGKLTEANLKFTFDKDNLGDQVRAQVDIAKRNPKKTAEQFIQDLIAASKSGKFKYKTWHPNSKYKYLKAVGKLFSIQGIKVPKFADMAYDKIKSILGEGKLNEKLARGLKPLLQVGSTITKNAGENALLKLSDKFDRIDDEYAGEIASWLDMAIELMQDGYAGDATKKLKQFNQKCKDVLKGKSIKSAFAEGVNEATIMTRAKMNYINFSTLWKNLKKYPIQKPTRGMANAANSGAVIHFSGRPNSGQTWAKKVAGGKWIRTDMNGPNYPNEYAEVISSNDLDKKMQQQSKVQIKEGKLNEDILDDAKAALENEYDWTNIEFEGDLSVRFDYDRGKNSMWVNKSGSISGNVPSRNARSVWKALDKLGLKESKLTEKYTGNPGDKLTHKHNKAISIELISPTNKGWKVYQIEKGKKKIAHFNKQDITGPKAIFEGKLNEDYNLGLEKTHEYEKVLGKAVSRLKGIDAYNKMASRGGRTAVQDTTFAITVYQHGTNDNTSNLKSVLSKADSNLDVGKIKNNLKVSPNARSKHEQDKDIWKYTIPKKVDYHTAKKQGAIKSTPVTKMNHDVVMSLMDMMAQYTSKANPLARVQWRSLKDFMQSASDYIKGSNWKKFEQSVKKQYPRLK